MFDLGNEVAKLQGQLALSTFRQKSHSSFDLNTEHNGVANCRVATTCSCEHARARLLLIEAVRFAESLRKLSQSLLSIKIDYTKKNSWSNFTQLPIKFGK